MRSQRHETAGTALVVGADSRIGRALIPALIRSGFAVAATTRRRHPGAADSARFPIDLEEVARTGSVCLPECEVAFLCAAVSSYAACRKDEATARTVNVEASAVIASALRARGSRLVFLSTNAVFDGERPFRSADERPDGATAYGRSKADAESQLLAIDPATAVIRLTRVFCPGEPLFAGWIECLRSGDELFPFADMVAAPISLDQVVTALCAIARRRESGILQLSARRDVSYLAIARHIARRIGASPERVQPIRAAERGIAPGEAPPHATLACAEFLARFGLEPIEPLDVVDAVLGLGSSE
jgi:dTDP-4-dehydrorhamnose reductase